MPPVLRSEIPGLGSSQAFWRGSSLDRRSHEGQVESIQAGQHESAHDDGTFNVPASTRLSDAQASDPHSGIINEDVADYVHEVKIGADRWNSRLGRQLGDAGLENGISQGIFIPVDRFDEVMTRENIHLELLGLHLFPTDGDLQKCLADICGPQVYGNHGFTSRRKLFAILVLLDRPDRICSFVEEGIWDRHLPFLYEEGTRQYQYHPDGPDSELCPISCFDEWNLVDKDLFDYYQWRVLSPVFNMDSKDVELHSLHDRTVLPFFTAKGDPSEKLLVAYGGFSQVRCVRIHPAHYRLQRGDKPMSHSDLFAIKSLLSGATKESFDREVEALQRFRNEEHPHLIKLLTTYRYYGRYHLVFLWAYGNLFELWMTKSRPTQTPELSLWLSEQSQGIAQALERIHRTDSGVGTNESRVWAHLGIKPENILWFAEPGSKETSSLGVLKITDFGETRWHLRTDIGGIDRERIAVSMTYRPPECDSEEVISQPWDVWALGCVYLEFITWYLCGWEAVEEFSKARVKESTSFIKEDNFFNLAAIATESSLGPKLKESVLTWIDKLRSAESASRFTNDFLDLISNHLLLVRQENRHRSSEVARALNIMYKHCRTQPGYCVSRLADEQNNLQAAVPTRLSTIGSDDESTEIDAETSEYAESIFSEGASSVTSLSSAPMELVSIVAQQELVQFFLGDAEFESLFKDAITDLNIGGDKLARNFRRMLKRFSRELSNQANTAMEQAGAKFVRSSSSYVASTIRRSLDSSQSSSDRSLTGLQNASRTSRGTEAVNRYLLELEQFNESAEDRDYAPEDAVDFDSDESDSADDDLTLTTLDQVKEFFRRGEPFENLKTTLKKFVKPSLKADVERGTRNFEEVLGPTTDLSEVQLVSCAQNEVQSTKPSLSMKSLPDLLDSCISELLLAPWEPPIPSGYSRIRWQCNCGQRLFDDFVEYKPGALSELQLDLEEVDEIERTVLRIITLSTRVANFMSLGVPVLQLYLEGALNAAGQGVRHMFNKAKKSMTSGNGPQLPTVNAISAAAPAVPALVNNLDVLLCVDQNDGSSCFHQEPLRCPDNDRDLFQFLRAQFHRHRSLTGRFNLHSLKRVAMVRFEVDNNSFADVHCHGSFCSAGCICLPPKTLVPSMYSCGPAPATGPLYHPPLGPNYLTHHFKKHHDLKRPQTRVYRQLPKLTSGPLHISPDHGELGWGLHFEKGWDYRALYFLLLLCIVLSCVFGITWAVVKSDIQGAFAIAGVVVTILSLVVGYISVNQLQ